MLANLVNITPITVGFMVERSNCWVYKPTNMTGGAPPCLTDVMLSCNLYISYIYMSCYIDIDIDIIAIMCIIHRCLG